MGHGGQLPAAQRGAVRCRPEPAEDLRRGNAGRQADFARLGRVRRHAAKQLRGRAQGHPRTLGDLLQPESRADLRRSGARLQDGRGHRQAGFPGRAPHAAGRAAGRLLLRPELPPCAGRHTAEGRFHIRAIDVIDMKTWKPVATIPTPGPGFFMRSHENSRYAWTDSMMSPTAKDTLTIIDKATLQPVASVREPGKTLAHIEFTKDGKYALASVWEMDGALIVFDAATFKEIKRLPMSKPVGKYNVWNKITRSEGTSH